MTNILLIVLTIIIVVIIVYNNNNSPELYGETLQYLGKIVANDDIDCNKNLIVNKNTTTKQICVGDVCLTKNDLLFLKKLPRKLDNKYCIGDTCVDENDMKTIHTISAIQPIEKLTFKVVSSGLVVGSIWGLSDFYLNNIKLKGFTIGRGFNILTLNENGKILLFRSFDTHGDVTARQKMIDYIKSIANGIYVLVAVADEASYKDTVKVTIFDKSWGNGWKREYKLNSDGSETKIPASWMEPHNPIAFPNDQVSSISVEKGLIGTLYEHSYDNTHGYGTGVIKNYYPGFHSVARNNDASALIIRKQNSSAIVSVYEALKLVGSNGKTTPNYRGSYALIGKKGMSPGQATEQTIHSNSVFSNKRTVVKVRSFKPDNTFLNIKGF